MKNYTAPKLTTLGSVVDLTQGVLRGNVDGGAQEVFPAGTIGFNL